MSNKNLTEFSDRIKYVREFLGLSKDILGKSVNVSGAYIGQLESGKKGNPSDLFLGAIEKVHRVNSVWLKQGTGSVFLENAIGTKETESSYGHGIADPQIREMITIMLQLDKPARADLLKQAKKELQLQRLKLLEDTNQVKSELIDALEPRSLEQVKKLEGIAPEAVEEQKKRNTVTTRKQKKELQ